MKKRLIIPISLLAAAILFSMLSLFGCDPLDIEGPELENIRPWVKWAITPSDSMIHSSNPELQWFGNDQDGQINDFAYGVFQGDYMDSVSRETSLVIPDTLTWISLGNVTSARIPLFASPDSSDTVGQYVVLRAIDDSGDSSAIINRYLYRTNHRPTCIVTVPGTPQWVLPQPTESWDGVDVAWEGGDSLDYPGSQPDFIWEVRIFGPYDSEPDSLDPDTSAIYFLRYLVDEDPDEDSLRIEATSASLINLRTGYYILVVRNFDDAFVPSIPTLGIFKVYEPHWINNPEEARDILVVNHTRYAANVWGELAPVYQDSVENFYSDMILAAGYTDDDFDWYEADLSLVGRDTLYFYRMVMAIDTDWRFLVSDDQQDEYGEYLDVGGNLWLLGRRSFDAIPAFGAVAYGGTGLPLTYMDLDGAYLNVSGEQDSVEFTGAISLMTDLPDLHVDTLRVSYTSAGAFQYSEALFGVGWMIRVGESEPLYLFNALHQTSLFHAFPVANRYDSGTYKTSYFMFPLYFIEDQSAFQLGDAMLEWFLGE